MGATFGSDYLIKTGGLCPSSTSFSACGWAYRTGGSGAQVLCGIDNGGNWEQIGFSTSTLMLTSDGGTFNFASSPAVNNWFFWAVTCAAAGAGNLKGYWAGVGATAFITQTGAGQAVATPRILIGSSAWSEYYTGVMAYVKVWNVELSAAELWQEMMSGLPVRYADINSHSPLWTAADAPANYAIPANAWTVGGTLADGGTPPVSYHVQTYSLYIEELVSSVGVLSATLGALSVAATGKAAVNGQLAKTLGQLAVSASGAVLVTGTLSKTLAAITLSAAGKALVAGTLSATLANASLTATGTAAVTGALSRTLAAATLSASGTVQAQGQLSQTLTAATVTAAGTAAIAGTLSQTLEDATATGTGTVQVEGTLTQTLAACTLAATGTVSSAGATGTLTQTLEDATVTATATAAVTGSATITLGDCGVVSAGTVSVSGALGQTLEDANVSAAGEVDVTGTLTQTLADASLSASGVVDAARIGTLNVTLADASLTAAGYQFWFGSVTVSDVLRDQVGLAIALVDDGGAGDQITDGVGLGHALIDDVTITEVEV